MASIGSFKKAGNEFQGQIVTLSVQAKTVRIAPETNRANDNARSHRVFVGKAEISAAWSKRFADLVPQPQGQRRVIGAKAPPARAGRAFSAFARVGRAPLVQRATEPTGGRDAMARLCGYCRSSGPRPVQYE
ncbi:DUF736 family protein [Roseiarcus sp.]|uniref:DUF736 family protein n=1 Tax=Roseiarcus sp. TaxID=1969460 RepID=UPI003F997DC5